MAAAQPRGPGFVLGFALGGFFDGIMLHQVLQWHHLLSLAPGDDLRRVESQILADGLFHVAMYLIALVGLYWLWRRRRELGEPGAGGRLLVWFVLGFAAWNVVDVVGFHWILHIHRIRVDTPPSTWLAWDWAWLALFGLAPLGLATAISRFGALRASPAALTLVIVGCGLLGLRAPEGANGRLVLFRAGLEPGEALEAVAVSGGAPGWVSADGRLVSAVFDKPADAWRLYGRGALLVGGPGSPAGCLSWTAARQGVAGLPSLRS